MKRRKNRWPMLILVVLLWIILFWIIFSTSPDFTTQFTIYNLQFIIPTTKIAFFLILTSALALTLGLVFHSIKKGLILALGFTTFLFLKMLQATNWLTLLLLIILSGIMLLA